MQDEERTIQSGQQGLEARFLMGREDTILQNLRNKAGMSMKTKGRRGKLGGEAGMS
jgi:hypothetical protein